MSRIPALLRAGLLAVLAWQAASAAVDLTAGVGQRAAQGIGPRLTWTSEQRLRAAVGDDAATLLALRDALPDGAIVVTREVRDMGESALLQQLRHTLYPVLLREVPVGFLGGPLRLAAGRPVFFLDLDAAGGAAPPGGGWVEPQVVGRLRLFRQRSD